MSRLRSPGRLLIGFLAVGTSIALFACGGSSSTATPATSLTPPQTTTQTAPGTTRLLPILTPTATTAPAAAAKTTVNITLKEWAMTLDKSTAPAGQVTFHAQVTGTIPHELKVVKSDLAVDALPIKDGTVDESKVQVVGTVPPIDAGKTGDGSFTLAAGKYILICNIPTHYVSGMRVAFTVQ